MPLHPHKGQFNNAYNIIYKIVNNPILRYRSPMTPTRMPRRRGVRRKIGTPYRAPALDIRGQSVAERIATSLEEDIVLGRCHPRARLIEQDLCDRFNTHRGDVRLALFELEKKGIVQRIPNRGAIVRDLTPKEVLEIYAVRQELEVMQYVFCPSPSRH